MFGSRKTSLLNWIAAMLSVGIIVFVIITGFVKGDASNLSPFVPYGVGETKKPSRGIPIGLIGSMSMITLVYCLMALSLRNDYKITTGLMVGALGQGRLSQDLPLDLQKLRCKEEIFASSFAATAYLQSINYPKDKKTFIYWAETTKEFITKLDLKTGQKVLGGGCGIGGGDFYMPDNFGVMACNVGLKEVGHKESDCQDGGIAYGC
ncbi:hypothetical protein IFM89_007135 [Coptis chinensis]|uniref:Uncharacterized protein n=1 Tax=Coptis chinensis TaxID=261450 RepID=A0A835HD05_9MAGN|nr:hypothetical protein IFM89_007135 [Coptis chinensis]